MSFLRRDSDFDLGDAVYQLTSNHSVQKLRLLIDMPLFRVFSPKDKFSVGAFNHVRDLHLQLDDHHSSFPVFSQIPNLEALFFRGVAIRGHLDLPAMPWSRLRWLEVNA